MALSDNEYLEQLWANVSKNPCPCGKPASVHFPGFCSMECSDKGWGEEIDKNPIGGRGARRGGIMLDEADLEEFKSG